MAMGLPYLLKDRWPVEQMGSGIEIVFSKRSFGCLPARRTDDPKKIGWGNLDAESVRQ